MKVVVCLFLWLSLPPAFCDQPTKLSSFEESLRWVFAGDFGFTLVGEKPVSADDSTTLDWELHPEKKVELHAFLRQAFQGSKVFLYIPLGDDSGWLIHREALTKQISSYKRLKAFVLGRYGSVREFFSVLEAADLSVFEALDFDPVLTSIVLGYGEANGEFYSRWIDLAEYLQKYPMGSLYPFQTLPDPGYIRNMSYFGYRLLQPISRPAPVQPWGSLEEEWAWMRRVDWPMGRYSEPEPPCYLSLPVYKARHCPESESIFSKYILARDKLGKLFCGRRPSEVIVKAANGR